MDTTSDPTRPTTTVVTTSIISPRSTASIGGAEGGSSTMTTTVQGNMSGAQGSAVTIPAIYSLGMIAATIENFTGKEVIRYYQKFEQRAELDGWTEQESLKLLRYKCVGEAYDFLISDPTLKELSFGALKARLVARFHASALPGESQLNLSKCYQRHDESVSAYCTRLRICSAKVLQEDLHNASSEEEPGLRKKSQDLALNQFKIGLRRETMKDIGILLLKEDNLTLEKAEHLVSLHETTVKMVQGRNSGHQVMTLTCYVCGIDGHMSRDCGNFKKRENTVSKCYGCGQSGHWARACPDKDRIRQRDVNVTKDHRGRGVFKEDQRGNRNGFGREDRPPGLGAYNSNFEGRGNRTGEYGGQRGSFQNQAKVEQGSGNFRRQDNEDRNRSYGRQLAMPNGDDRRQTSRNTGATPRVRWQDTSRNARGRNEGPNEGAPGSSGSLN